MHIQVYHVVIVIVLFIIAWAIAKSSKKDVKLP